MWNLSNINLPDDELTILSLGFSYLPHYPVDINRVLDDAHISIDKYCRLLKLKIHFQTPSNSTYTPNTDPIPKPPSTWVPESGAVMDMVDSYSKLCKQRAKTAVKHAHISPTDNLILATLHIMSKYTHIVFKPADKAMGPAYMSLDRYNDFCYSHLHDTHTYTKLDDPSTYSHLGTYDKLTEVLDLYDHLYETNYLGKSVHTKLAKSLLQLVNSPHLRLSVFYILPKVHKSPISSRPILSCLNSPLFHASIYLDKLLQPVIKNLPTVCLSSDDFILDINKLHIPPDFNILCADIASLYPSIPIPFGMMAVRSALSNLDYTTNKYAFSKEDIPFICDLLELVLTENYLQYNFEIYKQISGTAMGTPCAVVFAVLVVYYIESSVLDSLTIPPLIFKRYIDDFFIILHKDIDFVALFNAVCPGIKLPDNAVTRGDEGVFLDLNIYINPQRFLSTSIYEKPLNHHMYIPASSAHNQSLLPNLIISQLNRAQLRCTEDSTLFPYIEKFYCRLFNRGWTHAQLHPHFYTAIHPTRPELIERLIQRKLTTNLELPSTLILVATTPNKHARLPWKDILAFPPDLSSHPDTAPYIPDKVILGAKHYHNSSFYLSRHKRIWKTLPITPADPGYDEGILDLYNTHPRLNPTPTTRFVTPISAEELTLRGEIQTLLDPLPHPTPTP